MLRFRLIDTASDRDHCRHKWLAVRPLIARGWEIAERAWRLFATALSYGVYGLGALILWYGVYPLTCRCVAEAKREEYARFLSYLAFRFFTVFLTAMGVWRCQIEGAEKLKCPGRIIVANHPSFLDVVLLFAQMQNAVCVVKPGLVSLPLVGRPIRCCGHLPAADPQALVVEAVRTLKTGACLILFPQGTRTPPGSEIKFQRSTARIALEAGVPVVPVYLHYHPLLLGKHQRWYRIPKHRPQVKVIAGEEIQPQEVVKGLPISLASRQFSRYLEAYFKVLERRHGCIGK